MARVRVSQIAVFPGGARIISVMTRIFKVFVLTIVKGIMVRVRGVHQPIWEISQVAALLVGTHIIPSAGLKKVFLFL